MSLIFKEYKLSICISKYQVDIEEDGIRLDQYVQKYITALSREYIKKKITQKEITIDKRIHPLKASSKVHTGEIITVSMPASNRDEEFWNGQQIDLDMNPPIIFEDQDIVVISKPPFMSTHPTGRRIYYCATNLLEEKYQKKIYSIHRLDRETSGVLVMGKEVFYSNLISRQFEEGQIKKCYFFISKSKDDTVYNGPLEFTARERLDAGDDELTRVVVSCYPQDSKQGKRAETFFKIIHQENDIILGMAFPKTGRQHQIRVHAMAHNLSLLGDKIYWGGYEMFSRFKDKIATSSDIADLEIPRQALHAISLKLKYKNEDKVFTAPIPLDLITWLKKRVKIPVSEIEFKIHDTIKNYWNSL